ncbi:MAG: helix-turn-helix domain-containing protein [Bacteroidetes bacterium]|nr:helix-turn-helix domain-containing protein [Bacteroidota bacterium]
MALNQFHAMNIHLSSKELNYRELHTHDHHELVFCTNGSGFQINETQTMPLEQGDIFFFPAGQPHNSYCREGQRFSLLVFSFTRDAFSRKPDSLMEMLIPSLTENAMHENKIPCASPELVQPLLEKSLAEFRNHDIAYISASQLYLEQFFITLWRDKSFQNKFKITNHQPTPMDHIKKVVDYIEYQYNQPLSIAGILSFCPLSRSHFHTTFKQYTGCSFIEHLQKVRINNACRMLTELENLQMIEIAHKCGFGNQSHFCHVFRKIKKMSPGQYRKSVKLATIEYPAT